MLYSQVTTVYCPAGNFMHSCVAILMPQDEKFAAP